MPIAVSCPACSAAFNVKDEYAGRRAKCPKCGGPITVPGASPAPAAPAPAPMTRAVDDDADEAPPARSQRRPRADEDPPRTRRRRAADDAPKKKSALPIVLGILGGLVLLCGGGTAAVWFLVIVPAAEQAKAKLLATSPIAPPNSVQPAGTLAPTSKVQQPLPAGGAVTRANMEKVQQGMKLADVQGLLGGGEKAPSQIDLASGISRHDERDDARERWQAKARLGHVLMWSKGDDFVVAAFSAPPNDGGKVVGVFGRIEYMGAEWIRLGGGGSDHKPTPGSDINQDAPIVTLTADELANDYMTYLDKIVIVTGVAANDLMPGESLSGAKLLQQGGGKPIKFNDIINVPKGLKKGDRVEVWGMVSPTSVRSRSVELFFPTRLKPEGQAVSVAALLDAFLKDESAAEDKYRYKDMLTLTGTVKEIGTDTITVEERINGGERITVEAEFFRGKLPMVKVGDAITFHGCATRLEPAKDGKRTMKLDFCRLALTARPPGPTGK